MDFGRMVFRMDKAYNNLKMETDLSVFFNME